MSPRKLFPSQLANEQIFLVVREHWFHVFLKLLVWAFFLAAYVVADRYAMANFPQMFLGQSGQVTNLFIDVYLIFLILALFIIYLLYYLNIQVITSIRIVDVTQEGLFSHTVSELHIDKIEDATSQTNGVFGTIFNYGNVYVQTAGATDRFEFNDVPNPAAIEKLVLDLYEKNSNFAKNATEAAQA